MKTAATCPYGRGRLPAIEDLRFNPCLFRCGAENSCTFVTKVTHGCFRTMVALHFVEVKKGVRTKHFICAADLRLTRA